MVYKLKFLVVFLWHLYFHQILFLCNANMHWVKFLLLFLWCFSFLICVFTVWNGVTFCINFSICCSKEDHRKWSWTISLLLLVLLLCVLIFFAWLWLGMPNSVAALYLFQLMVKVICRAGQCLGPKGLPVYLQAYPLNPMLVRCSWRTANTGPN